MVRLWLPLCVGALGCAPTKTVPTAPAPPPPARPQPSPAPVGAEGPVYASEAHARMILAARFREAGLRIVYDVPLSVGGAVLVIDGYDPERGVGYEYRSTADPRQDLATFDGKTLLIVGPTTVEELERAVDSFFASRDQAATRER